MIIEARNALEQLLQDERVQVCLKSLVKQVN
jgi:hypothetical protein